VVSFQCGNVALIGAKFQVSLSNVVLIGLQIYGKWAGVESGVEFVRDQLEFLETFATIQVFQFRVW